MKRMICTALTALLLVGAPIVTFAQAGGSAPAAQAPAKPEKKAKKAKKTHHKKMKKAKKGKTAEKPAAGSGSQMK